MSTFRSDTAFLFDVGNTLLANDRVIADLSGADDVPRELDHVR